MRWSASARRPRADHARVSGALAAAAGSYTASFRFCRCNADGTLAGTQMVTRTFALEADGNSTTGTIAAQVNDTVGAGQQGRCGTDPSVRLF